MEPTPGSTTPPAARRAEAVPAPQPPRATRLKPAVLLAVLALAGVTALVTVLAVARSRPATPAPAASSAEPLADEHPAQPDFLARPPQAAQGPGPVTLGTIEQERLDALLAQQSAGLEPPVPPDAPAEAMAEATPAADGSTPGSPAPPDPRARALEESLRPPLRPPAFAPLPPPAATVPPLPTAADLQALLKAPPPPETQPPAGAPDTPAGSLSTPGGSLYGGPSPALPSPRPSPGDVSAARTPAATDLPFAYDRTPRPFRLRQGTVLPAILLPAVSSDLPGTLVAQLSRDVYDSLDQARLLLPRGSRLLGRYENQIALGQNRLLVAWDRILFPDGTSLSLPGLP